MTWHPEESPSPTPAPAPTPTPAPAPTPIPATTPTASPEESLEEAEPAIDLWNLNKETIPLLSKRQLQQITPRQFRKINSDDYRYFSARQVKHLDEKIFKGRFDEDLLDDMATLLIDKMTKTQIRSLSRNSMKELGYWILMMEEHTIQKFSPSQIGSIESRAFRAMPNSLLNQFSKQQINAFTPSQINQLTEKGFTYRNIQDAMQEGGWIKNLDHSIELSDFPQELGEKILKASLEQAVEKVIFKHLEKRRYDDLTFNWIFQEIPLDKRGIDKLVIRFKKSGDETKLFVYDGYLSDVWEAERIPASKVTERIMWGIYQELDGDVHRVNGGSDYIHWNFGD